MNSPFTTAFDDVPRMRLVRQNAFNQTAEWEQQPATTFVRRTGSGLERNRSTSGYILHFQGNSYEQTRSNRDLLGQLRKLQQYYTILDSDSAAMEHLEEEPALFTLLVEAVRPLKIAFGEKRLLHIRVQHSDDESLLKVAVQIPANFGDEQAEEALRSFDQQWWLKNCGRSGGALVIDYEIQDGI
jgi:hypothetical protein